MAIKKEVWDKIERDYVNNVYPSIIELAKAYGINDRSIRKKSWYVSRAASSETREQIEEKLYKIEKGKKSSSVKNMELLKEVLDSKLSFRKGANVIMQASLKLLSNSVSELLTLPIDPVRKIFAISSVMSTIGKYSDFNALSQEKHKQGELIDDRDDILEGIKNLIKESQQEKAEMRQVLETSKKDDDS